MAGLRTLLAALAAVLMIGAEGLLAQPATIAPADPSLVSRPAPLPAQEGASPNSRQTLEEILRRQQGLGAGEDPTPAELDAPASAVGAGAAGPADPAAAAGSRNAEMWRAVRYNVADARSQVRAPGSTVLVQDSGMSWLTFREGPLRFWGGVALLAVIALLTVFYLIRGRMRIDHGWAGVTVERFKGVERFGHWLLAGSFVLLGVTGLITLFGRYGLIPLMGKEAYATLAIGSKWIHNNVAWAFMLGLVLTFVLWVAHNVPSRVDWQWIKAGGGFFSNGSHPAARKFNFGQKVVFWLTMLLGASVSASGLSLLFPFELPMFAKTFAAIETTGLPALVGASLPTELAPHQEMQLAQLWHTIVGFAMMAFILAHIYIGSVGMQGAFDAMGSGKVDLNWAKEHHNLWVEELRREGRQPDRGSSGVATPAE